jgi:signal recognition particle receptor subunit beta
MVEFNREQRVIKVKIAYYGPAVGGKTTNLKILYDRANPARRGEFVSVNSQQDRTILCDLLPIRSGGLRGYDLRFQLAAVPGQAVYAPARRVVLRGADAVVFVANSATDRWHENLQSFREMQGHLLAQQIDPMKIPMVLQYNKRDLPEVMEIEALERGMNSRRVPFYPAVAVRGEGVLETFAAVVRAGIGDLGGRYPELALPEGETIAEWTEQAMTTMFGRIRPAGEGQSEGELVAEDPPEAAPADATSPSRYLLRVSMPEEAGVTAAAASDSRAGDLLAESYAQASTELGLQVTDLREQRDLARSRLAEVKIALELAEQKTGEGEVEDRAQRILSILMRSADASNASLLLTTSDPPQVLVLPPLVTDPLARTEWGAQHLHELREIEEPQLEEGESMPQLVDALSAAEPFFESVAIVPFRSAERVLALAILYYRPHMALPTDHTLEHVGFLARVLTGPLEAAAAREATASVDRMRALSRASAAAMASLLTRLPPSAARRALLAVEDVLAPMRVPGVTVTVVPGTPSVAGDASLLRYAVATLVSRCESAALERSIVPVIGVYAALEEGFVRIHVWLGESAAAVGARVGSQAHPLDSDAEMTAVYAVMALHQGFLVTPETVGAPAHFVLQLTPAEA